MTCGVGKGRLDMFGSSPVHILSQHILSLLRNRCEILVINI